ncbi:hypothetical protein [Hubei dimarhabdovirus 1]|uniref:Uncharacterized protein n=1 Tax=Hubei dimarhabdovirus 1 TaxID=2849739 RepID=A0A1L3KMU8_9RHAB|nr:hypothetical protein [Hubei dimarhabdovirus 1]APG78741.1 hypothetical protein [Hubei dimarhabdovirus 1]
MSFETESAHHVDLAESLVKTLTSMQKNQTLSKLPVFDDSSDMTDEDHSNSDPDVVGAQYLGDPAELFGSLPPAVARATPQSLDLSFLSLSDAKRVQDLICSLDTSRPIDEIEFVLPSAPRKPSTPKPSAPVVTEQRQPPKASSTSKTRMVKLGILLEKGVEVRSRYPDKPPFKIYNGRNGFSKEQLAARYQNRELPETLYDVVKEIFTEAKNWGVFINRYHAALLKINLDQYSCE